MNPDEPTVNTAPFASDHCECAAGAKPSMLQGHLEICGDWHQSLVVQELMACCARTYGFEDFAIRKSIKEALTNAFKHGNAGAPEKCIRVDYRVDDTEFRAAISDDGFGFNHAELGALNSSNNRSGRGLGLMQHYMTVVRFNDRGNCVEILKRKNL